jgi:hypothetical protein
MARKGWTQLTPAYRQRLEKAGITQSEYESGASIRAARGHQHTPERPTAGTPQTFPKYFQERQRLYLNLERRKLEVFGQSDRWDDSKSKMIIRKYHPSFRLMKWALTATDEEIYDALREQSEDFVWLGYH